jgi:hypothetical protein
VPDYVHRVRNLGVCCSRLIALADNDPARATWTQHAAVGPRGLPVCYLSYPEISWPDRAQIEGGIQRAQRNNLTRSRLKRAAPLQVPRARPHDYLAP